MKIKIQIVKILFPLLFIYMSIISCGKTESGDDRWTSLFNGKDLTGWTVKKVPADSAKNYWSVVDGCIQANSIGDKNHDYIWLVSDKEYSNFILCLSYQIYKYSTGNSGVQIRSRYDNEAGWLDGPQIDIHPPDHWRTGMVWDETRDNKRWLYPDIPRDSWVDETMANPDMIYYYSDEGDGWNDLEITAHGTKIFAALNGIPVLRYDGNGVLNDKVHQNRNVGMRGHIALQIHTGDELKILFKNIKIRELK
ncbi:DUF1080 domain-containing protein [candidate division KSB1 bacterium]|nr:DUF1080 domain-containing protein [candidate division KSB1 bacterium]